MHGMGNLPLGRRRRNQIPWFHNPRIAKVATNILWGARRRALARSVVVASSDYMKLLPDSIKEWIPNTMVSLGTDGFGMSETREALRDHFEVDERWVVLATLTALKKDGLVKAADIKKAMKALDINVDKRDPMPLV